MHLTTQAYGNLCLIRAEESRIDAEGALAFKEAMRRAAADAGPVVVLDLGKVDFIDSSGLGALVSTMKALAPAQSLQLAGMRPPVRRVFELTRMDTVFTLYDTPEEALERRGD
ncbi:MAG: STAS domain-containing protein [Sulfitobacter sp.]|nr:STAS domain-containing protein [Sulfitobacter sp.]